MPSRGESAARPNATQTPRTDDARAVFAELNPSGKHYEAQQLCKSLYSRWKRKDKDKAYDIITVRAFRCDSQALRTGRVAFLRLTLPANPYRTPPTTCGLQEGACCECSTPKRA